MTLLTGLTALIMVVGLVGIVLPVLPGLLLVALATLFWAAQHPDSRSWIVVGVAAALYVAGVVTQYLVPGRRLRRSGVGTATLVLAVLLGIVGFFVIPVLGGPIGFVLGILLVELARQRRLDGAWAATRTALVAVLHSMGIELIAGMSIVCAWVVGLLLLGQGS